jgi:hypothetical protein
MGRRALLARRREAALRDRHLALVPYPGVGEPPRALDQVLQHHWPSAVAREARVLHPPASAMVLDEHVVAARFAGLGDEALPDPGQPGSRHRPLDPDPSAAIPRDDLIELPAVRRRSALIPLLRARSGRSRLGRSISVTACEQNARHQEEISAAHAQGGFPPPGSTSKGPTWTSERCPHADITPGRDPKSVPATSSGLPPPASRQGQVDAAPGVRTPRLDGRPPSRSPATADTEVRCLWRASGPRRRRRDSGPEVPPSVRRVHQAGGLWPLRGPSMKRAPRRETRRRLPGRQLGQADRDFSAIITPRHDEREPLAWVASP